MKKYHQYCGVARALDRVGQRWTLLLVRDLLLGPRRFTDLARAHPGLTPNLLSDRLRHLEEEGIVVRDVLPPPAASRVYRLSARGQALEPVLLALAAWGGETMTAGPRPEEHVDLRWGLLALKRQFRGGRQPGAVAVKSGLRRFRVDWSVEGEVGVEEGSASPVGVTITGRPESLASALFGGVSLRRLEGEGLLEVEGSRSVLSAFVVAFGLSH